jgi:hypothetical protein
MPRKRVTLRPPFDGIYNGRTRLSASKRECLPEVWLFLDYLRSGEIEIRPPPGPPKFYEIKLPSGRVVYLAIGLPNPDDPDRHADLYVQDIAWPEDLN